MEFSCFILLAVLWTFWICDLVSGHSIEKSLLLLAQLSLLIHYVILIFKLFYPNFVIILCFLPHFSLLYLSLKILNWPVFPGSFPHHRWVCQSNSSFLLKWSFLHSNFFSFSLTLQYNCTVSPFPFLPLMCPLLPLPSHLLHILHLFSCVVLLLPSASAALLTLTLVLLAWSSRHLNHRRWVWFQCPSYQAAFPWLLTCCMVFCWKLNTMHWAIGPSVWYCVSIQLGITLTTSIYHCGDQNLPKLLKKLWHSFIPGNADQKHWCSALRFGCQNLIYDFLYDLTFLIQYAGNSLLDF